jgi:hypothetical protein
MSLQDKFIHCSIEDVELINEITNILLKKGGGEETSKSSQPTPLPRTLTRNRAFRHGLNLDVLKFNQRKL